MLNISQEAKNQYLNDDRVQRIFISYDDIVLTDSNIMMSSLSLDEPLCTDDNLVFGGAEAKMLKLKLLNTKLEINNLTGKKIYVNSLIAKQINNMNVGNVYYTAVVNSSLGMIAVSGDRNRLLKVDERGKILLKIRLDKKAKCIVIKDNNIYVVPFNTNDVMDVYAIGEQGFVHTDTINLEAYQKEQIAGMSESIVYEDGIYKEYANNKEYVFESVPYGYFICEKPVKEQEYIISLTAYDELIKFDIDITEWWNSLSYPLTIDDMFKSLCDYCGVPYEETTHINGDYTFNAKPADLSNIKGRDVLKMIGQATCTFIKMNRYGKCTMRTIDVDTINYELDLLKEDIDVSEYSTAPIDKVQIRVEEDDIGVIVGEGANAYVIQGNYLLYSQSDEQLRPYAENIYDVVSKIVYRPYSLNTVELPFIEAGDVIKVTTMSQTFNALVMNRELSSGNDMFSADGTESREIVTDVNSSIINLQGKVNVLKRDIDETISLIKDPATGLESQIKQQAGQIESVVKDVDGLESTVTQQAGQIESVVKDVDGLESEITQQAGEIQLVVEKSTFKNLIVNSDFSNISENTAYENAPYAWATDGFSPALTTSIVQNNDFVNNRAVRIIRPNGGADQFYQKINVSYTKATYSYYISFDFKANVLPSGSSFSTEILFYFSDGSISYAQKSTPLNGSFPGVGQYKRMMYEISITPSTEKKLIGMMVCPVRFLNTLSYDIEIGGVMMVDADLGKPELYSWSDIGSNDIISMINIAPDGIKIQAEKIDLVGVTTIRDPDGDYTKISGSTIETSTINSSTINSTILNTAYINELRQINGTTINADGNITIPNWNGLMLRLFYKNGIVTGFDYGIAKTPYGTPNGTTLFCARSLGRVVLCAYTIADGKGGYITAPEGQAYWVYSKPNGMMTVGGANAETMTGAIPYDITLL